MGGQGEGKAANGGHAPSPPPLSAAAVLEATCAECLFHVIVATLQVCFVCWCYVAAVRIQFQSASETVLNVKIGTYLALTRDREGGRKDRQSSTRMSNIHDTDDDNRE